MKDELVILLNLTNFFEVISLELELHKEKKKSVQYFFSGLQQKKKKKRGLFLIHGKPKERIITSVQISL